MYRYSSASDLPSKTWNELDAGFKAIYRMAVKAQYVDFVEFGMEQQFNMHSSQLPSGSVAVNVATFSIGVTKAW